MKIPQSQINKAINEYTDKIIKQIEDEYKKLSDKSMKQKYIQELKEKISRGDTAWLS